MVAAATVPTKPSAPPGWREFRCPKCGKLLARTALVAGSRVELYCDRRACRRHYVVEAA